MYNGNDEWRDMTGAIEILLSEYKIEACLSRARE